MWENNNRTFPYYLFIYLFIHSFIHSFICLFVCVFARFNGSYPRVYGGWAGDAFIALTGGVAERIEAKEPRPLPSF